MLVYDLINKILVYIMDKFIFKGVSSISKNLSGVMISEMDLTVEVFEGLSEFSALMLCWEKNMTRFSIY